MFARNVVIAVSLLAASACAERAHAEAVIGKPAPDFTLNDTEGKPVELSSLRGKTVVLEWFNPDCPFVKHAHGKGPLKGMSQRYVSNTLEWLTINSNAPTKQGHGLARNREARVEFGIKNRVLLDESGKVGRAYGAEKTPHLFVIDTKGKLVYRGGLDNAPVGVVDDARPRLKGTPAGKLEPYLELALQDIAQSKPVRLADTPAYGCTVKY